MQFSQEVTTSSHTIRAYAPGEVTINLPYEPRNEEELRGRAPPERQLTARHSVIVTPQHLVRDWPPQRFEELEVRHFETIAGLNPEIVLFGSGRQLRWPSGPITDALVHQGIGVEVMDTAAACRTYNVLMADGRRVAAALLII